MPFQFQRKRYALNALLAVLVGLLLMACSELPVNTAPTSTTVAVAAVTSTPARTPRPARPVATPTEEAIVEPTEASEPEPTETPEEAVPTPTPRKSLGGGFGEPSATPDTPVEATPELTPRSTATGMGQEPTPTATLMPSKERAEIFDEVWTTVRDNYLYEDFRGADWDALYDEYEPKVASATSAEEFYQVVDDMIQELGDDHSRYLSPWEADEEDDLMSGNTSYVGIGIFSRYMTSTIQVVYVFPGSPAEESGLMRRDVITAVDGLPITEDDADLSRIRGPAGSSVTLTVTSPGEPTREVTLTRRAINGKVLPSSRRLEADDSIGYLVIPSFDPADMDELVAVELSELLESETPLKGVIIDLRGNGGGLLDTMERIVGQFMTGRSGRYAARTNDRLMIPPRGALFEDLKSMPLVVLVDGGSESASEMMTGALQDRGRAKVVGVPSAGNTETVYPYDYNDGSRLWVAEEGFQLLDGTTMEGTGVIPDEQIEVDWTQYSEREDPHILRAIEVIRDAQ